MSLFNILNKLRRETTETIVGVAVTAVPVAAFVFLDRYIALAIVADDPNISFINASINVSLLLLLLVVGFIAAAIIVHEIGEIVCDALERRGTQWRSRKSPWTTY